MPYIVFSEYGIEEPWDDHHHAAVEHARDLARTYLGKSFYHAKVEGEHCAPDPVKSNPVSPTPRPADACGPALADTKEDR